MTCRFSLVFAGVVIGLMLRQISWGIEPQGKKLPSYCPPPGTTVPLSKAVSEAFINDFKGCDIVAEAVFFKMGNQGYALGDYDTKNNVTFQVLEPGGKPQSVLGLSYGTFAGIPKANADVLFQLKQGDLILLRGAPISIFSLVVFHAESVTQKK